MNENEFDDRDPISKGYAWSVIVSSIGMEMVVPPLIGLWIDRKCGTIVLFTILGAVLGMVCAISQLVGLGKNNKKNGN
jgi:hypothetical protein